MARDTNNSWQAATPPSGKTITNYSLENNGVEVIEVGNVLQANGVSVSDAEINMRVRAKYNDGTYGPYSNVVTIAAASGGSSYDPSATGKNIVLAIDGNTDVSASANNNLVVPSGFGAPTLSAGINTFNASENDLLQLQNVISQAGAFTFIFKIGFNTRTASASTKFALAPSYFGIKTDGKLNVVVGASTDASLDVSTVFPNANERLVTISRDASDNCFIQFDNEAPIALFGGATSNSAFNLQDFGGSSSISGRHTDIKLGRMILFDAQITGNDLTEAKSWVQN